MFAKLADPGFLADIRPLVSPEAAERLTRAAINAAFVDVFTRLVSRIPGKPWARSEEMAARYGIALASSLGNQL